MSKYKIYKNIKTKKFFIKKKVSLLGISWFKTIKERIDFLFDFEDRIIYFENLNQAKSYIKDVIEWENTPHKYELVEEIIT